MEAFPEVDDVHVSSIESHLGGPMQSPIQKAVFRACREFMKPIVRMLLRNGVGYREFMEITKATFVEVASDDHGIRGRKTNMSRVAVMTGLSRKEVRKIREAMEADPDGAVFRARRPELVLSIWHTNPDFLDKKHLPKRIRFDGEGPTFCDLVARVGGDIPPRAMLIELLRAGSVVEDGEKLRAVSRSYVPDADDPQAILLAGVAIRDLVSTIHHNLSCKDPESRLLERHVYSERLPKAYRTRFRKLARERGQLLLQDLNSWLSEKEIGIKDNDAYPDEGRSPRIGVGVYFFDHANSLPRERRLEKKPR
jgi:hypothetical protein